MRHRRMAIVAAFAAVLSLTVVLSGPTVVRSEPAWLTGRLLVATAQMGDPRFTETVIFIFAHDANGAMGLVVNRPIGDVPFTRLMERLGIESEADGDVRVHYGGPVEQELGFVLHSPDYVGDGTLVVDGLAAVTARPHVLKAIAAGEGPRYSLVTFGYAGWGPGQLEGELARGDWIIVPADEGLVFDDDYGSKWHRAIALRNYFI